MQGRHRDGNAGDHEPDLALARRFTWSAKGLRHGTGDVDDNASLPPKWCSCARCPHFTRFARAVGRIRWAAKPVTDPECDQTAQHREITISVPLVTVLLPSLRVDAWLKRSLESILCDGYPRIEVILLLDGIMDVPAESWLHDPRVIIVPLGPRGGIVRALNIGLGMATSEFIARMDGDDISLNGRLRAQVDFMQANLRVAVLGCQAVRIDEHERSLGRLDMPLSDSAIKRRLLVRNSMVHPTIMFRKSAVLEVGGYSAAAKTTEDYDLYLRLALNYDFANLADCYLQYRVHSGQVSRGFTPFSADKWTLVRRRQRLARSLKRPFVIQIARDILWYVAQLARYLGLREKWWRK